MNINFDIKTACLTIIIVILLFYVYLKNSGAGNYQIIIRSEAGLIIVMDTRTGVIKPYVGGPNNTVPYGIRFDEIKTPEFK